MTVKEFTDKFADTLNKMKLGVAGVIGGVTLIVGAAIFVVILLSYDPVRYITYMIILTGCAYGTIVFVSNFVKQWMADDE